MGYPRPASLPPLTLADGAAPDENQTDAIARAWLLQLQKRLVDRNFNDLETLFLEDSWWRDFVALSWDLTSKHGLKNISDYLATANGGLGALQLIETGGLKPTLVQMGGLAWIQFGFDFTIPRGTGKGFVRLANVGTSNWKAWLVFTQLEHLAGVEELTADEMQQPRGADKNGTSHSEIDPAVLIIGAGQSGLALAARLRSLGVNALLVDKHSQIGGSWPDRYKTVTLHTPTYTDHYPFFKNTEDLPKWLPRDKVIERMKHYSRAMDLNVQLSTEVTKIEYDESAKKYRVSGQGPGGPWSSSPRHLVLATGVFSEEPVIPSFPGQDSFQGQVYHSVQHRSASDTPDLDKKRVVLIGSGTSAHDLAQDFVDSGVKEVTIVQRGPIYSLSREAMEAFQVSLWNIPGVTTEEADIMGNSIPTGVARTMNLGATSMTLEHDKDMLDGLKKAGLALNTPETGESIVDYQVVKTGHFYIDQGANQMIIDGRIKVHRSEGGVKDFDARGVNLANGTHLDADIVILATGFKPNRITVRRLMGEKAYQRSGGDTFGFLDQEQERVGWWRPTGVPGFWFTTGSFMWSRMFSWPLALQIAAAERGLNESWNVDH